MTASEKFIDHLEYMLNAKRRGNNWFLIDSGLICTTCARRRRNTLYIHIDGVNKPYLNCFRIGCDLKRYIAEKDFDKLGFDDKPSIKALMDMKSDQTSFEIDNRNDTCRLVISDKIPSQEQIEYFKNRTGITLNESNISFYRFIPNLHQVLMENFKDDIHVMHTLDKLNIRPHKYSINFYTNKGDTFTYRSIKYDKKAKITTGLHESYYEIMGDGDKVEWLFVAEGIFDIINFYHRYGGIDNGLYVALNGSTSYVDAISKYYMDHMSELKHLVLIIDSDITIEEDLLYTYDKNIVNNIIKRLDRSIRSSFKEIWIVHNKASKDFGDMSKPIVPSKELYIEMKD